ncbi:MAG: nitronate monooxygenase [Proteobacteria bacterium]|nr:nitronate monooxygenase [Pseudomonadota bacterium]MBU1610432.1 nitronate monooxygenase [Pseudomonadota bacterium]
MNLPQLKIGDLIARRPIVQGGMGVGISLSGLASAVANEGGVGVIATPMIGIEEPDITTDPVGANRRALVKQIRRCRELSQGVIGVNIMCALTNFADLVKTSVKEKADIIFVGAGLPLDLPAHLPTVEEMGGKMKTKIAPIVSSGRAATLICRKWLKKYNMLPDAFVVEGPKAGGHLGFKAEQLDDPDFCLEKILPETIEAVKAFEEAKGCPIPVIAAGGVYSGQDICKFLDMGAAGVQMGTRFVATHECDADPRFKQAFINAGPSDMHVIKSPVGLPGRAVNNDFLRAVENGQKHPAKCPFHCLSTCKQDLSPYCIARALINAKRGILKHGFAFAGSNAYLVEKIISVKELMNSLVEEAQECKAGAKQYFEERKETAKRYIEDVKGQMNEKLGDVKGQLEDVKGQVAGKLEGVKEQMVEKLQEKMAERFKTASESE